MKVQYRPKEIRKELKNQKPVIYENVKLQSAKEEHQTWTVTIHLYWIYDKDGSSHARVILPWVDGDINKTEDIYNAVEEFLIEKDHFAKGRESK